MRLERSITVLAAAVLAGWLLAVLLCNGLFYRNIVNYEILYHGMAECWAQAAVRSRTGKICLLAVRVLQVAAVACITCSRLRRTGSLFLGTAIGFCGGVFFSLLVWSCGMAGGFCFWRPVSLRIWLICLACSCFWSVEDRTGLCRRTGFCIILFCCRGIWMELYVSPLSVKLF